MSRALCLALIVLVWSTGERALAQDTPWRAVLTGGIDEYVVRPGDTLASVSARFGTGTATLVQLNKLDRARPLVIGRWLTIDNRHIAAIDPDVEIAINVAQRMLYFVDGDHVRAFPIAVGTRDWPTPLGAFSVVEKEENPTWDVPSSIQEEMRLQGQPVVTRMPPSPRNPLGAYWIRLSFPNLGIHGTIAPASVYRYASHGCIRMHPEDVAALFERVMVGAAGVIRYQPVIIAMIEGRVYLEAHPDVYRRAPDAANQVLEYSRGYGFADRVDWPATVRVMREQRGLAVDVTKED